MRIAVLAPYVPHAGIDHAGGRWLRDWVQGLSDAGADVTVVAPTDPAAGAGPGGESWRTVTVDCPPPVGTARRLSRLLTYAPDPGTIRAHRDDPAVAEVMAASDIVEVQWTDWLAVERAVAGRRPHGRPVVAVAIDVISDAKARQAAAADRRRSRLVARVQGPAFARAEVRSLGRCAGVLTFSPRDAALLRQAGLEVPVRRVSPRLDEAEPGAGPAVDGSVLFVAQYNRPENTQAARWLLEGIWPLVHHRRPDAVLVLAGAGGDEWLSPDPARNVQVTGRVEDLRPYYRQARIAVAPLRRGAGFKFKVAQALVAGLPAVVTSVGADGFDELGGLEHLAVADDTEGFADAIVALLADPGIAARGEAAAAWARGAFDFHRDVAETLRWYAELTG